MSFFVRRRSDRRRRTMPTVNVGGRRDESVGRPTCGARRRRLGCVTWPGLKNVYTRAPCRGLRQPTWIYIFINNLRNGRGRLHTDNEDRRTAWLTWTSPVGYLRLTGPSVRANVRDAGTVEARRSVRARSTVTRSVGKPQSLSSRWAHSVLREIYVYRILRMLDHRRPIMLCVQNIWRTGGIVNRSS